MEKLKIGITTGDFNGISMEVILKTLSDKRLLSMCHVIVYGSAKVLAYHKNIVQNLGEMTIHAINDLSELQDEAVNVLTVWQENVKIALGTVTEEAGRFAFAALEAATADLQAGKIDALVTAPIHKKAMQMAEFQYTGHTEYLTAKFGAQQSLMLMVSDNLRIGVATNHIPLHDVARTITRDLLVRKLQLMNETLRMDFGIERPTIAVLGLNPHASDEGTIGHEEAKVIIPAIEAAKKSGVMAIGPYPADGFFGSGTYKQFDGVLAMYHDQGLVPFKLLSFEAGVNYTAGLPYVRTSPDHGTAYNIAGQNAASPDSLLKAIFLALDVVQQRALYSDMRSNPLQTIAVDEKLFEEDEAI